MTHRIVVDLATGTTTQVEYTAEEQAVHDAAIAAQEAIVVETLAEVIIETPAELPTEPAENT
jgi:hypothetical protein